MAPFSNTRMDGGRTAGPAAALPRARPTTTDPSIEAARGRTTVSQRFVVVTVVFIRVLITMDDPNSPSWLGESTNSAPAEATPEPVAAPAATNNSATATSTTDPDEADLPGIILIMRLANMGCAAALIACSVRRRI